MKVNLFVATPLLKTCVNFLGGFWGAKIVKSEKSLKILKNMAKTTSITILLRTFTCILNKKKNLFEPRLFQRSVIIFGGFWGTKIVKSEHNLENI